MEVTALCIFNLLSLPLSKTRFHEFWCYLVQFYQPYPLSRNVHFSAVFTLKMPPTSINCFSFYKLTFLLLMLFIIRKRCMFNIDIKCLCLKCVELYLVKWP